MTERNKLFISVAAAALLAMPVPAMADLNDSIVPEGANEKVVHPEDNLRKAHYLYNKGLFAKARDAYKSVPVRTELSEGYALLCSIKLETSGYEYLISDYKADYPGSPLIPDIDFAWAMNLFDNGDYAKAGKILHKLPEYEVPKSKRTEYHFKSAYCHFAEGGYEDAKNEFLKVEDAKHSDYKAPSRYALGYIAYDKSDFSEAENWFSKSYKDSRFKDISAYYLVECRFMQKDYDYVTKNGPAVLETCSIDRMERMARIISESYLVKGDKAMAKAYFEKVSDRAPKTRSDFFYAGSLMYALGNYKEAVDYYSKMTDRTDSLGQIANYNMAYSYIKTKNKIGAYEAFEMASKQKFDPQIAEDALFNFAKLCFDVNDDSSAFVKYLKTYPETKKEALIYNYIAVAALKNKDYEGAIAAYDKIDELDSEMTLNYMKANYLRAGQLIGDHSWKKASTHLKTAVYFSDKRSGFNQLSRYWLAESDFRQGNYSKAKAGFVDLYNTSALFGMKEAALIPYNVAYSSYMLEDYEEASRWFAIYLSHKDKTYPKEAMERLADCYFITKDYPNASLTYKKVVDLWFDANDIYPYYQCGLAYGLMGKDQQKVDILNNVWKAKPDSRFYPDAMYELGRAHIKMDHQDEAVRCFDNIVNTVKDSTFIARSLIELGMVERNASHNQKALEYYKTVVEKLPLSEYADDALLAIEGIYEKMNEPETYLAYIGSIGKASLKSEDDRELMIFNAAEQVFLSENYQKALVSLENYQKKYPQGKMLSKADFYIAESYKNLGKKEQACEYYSRVINKGSDSYVEMAMLNFANISYSLQDYRAAFGAYQSLFDAARLENNRYVALDGMMRSAYAAKDFVQAIKYAKLVETDVRSGAEEKLNAKYIQAKSYLATSERERALTILKELAGNTQTVQGAEASYIMVQDSYDRADYPKVDELVYAFADSGTPYMYYLAKSFILLGDTFVERDDLEQAKATFESVRDGYEPSSESDDILENINMRLKKLEELMK